MNKRDERGWRIPKKGTKTWELYHFIVAGWKTKDIAFYMNTNQNTLRVLTHGIKNPKSKNASALKWIKDNPERARSHRKKSLSKFENGQRYSKYVQKLVRDLKISFTEAVFLEKLQLEKENATKNRLQLQSSGGSSS